MYRLNTHFLFYFLGAALSYGQTSGTETDPASKNITIEFTAVAWEHAVNDVSTPKASKPEKLEIPAFAQSKIYHYTGINPIIFERNDPEYAKSHPEYKPPTKTVLIPPLWKKVIFLVLPASDGGFSITPVRDDAEEFKSNSVRIINTSAERVAIKTRTEMKVLPSNEHGIFTIPDGEKQIEFVYAQLDGTAWKLKGSTAFQVNPGDRCTVFITRTNSAYFQESSQRFDEKGNASNIKLPPRPFQLFTITEKAKPKE